MSVRADMDSWMNNELQIRAQSHKRPRRPTVEDFSLVFRALYGNILTGRVIEQAFIGRHAAVDVACSHRKTREIVGAAVQRPLVLHADGDLAIQ